MTEVSKFRKPFPGTARLIPDTITIIIMNINNRFSDPLVDLR